MSWPERVIGVVIALLLVAVFALDLPKIAQAAVGVVAVLLALLAGELGTRAERQ